MTWAALWFGRFPPRRAGALASALAASVLLAGCASAGGAASPAAPGSGSTGPGSGASGQAEGGTTVSPPPLRLAGCPTGPASMPATPAPPATPSAPAARGATEGGGEPLPRLRLSCLGAGPAVDLADLRGTPTVLNFWAAWCAPCRSELPLFERLHQRAGDRVRVLGVDFRDQKDSALELLADLGLTYPSLSDPDGMAARALPNRGTGLPVTLFVNAAGAVTFAKIGPVRSPAELDALVSEHLGVRP